MPFFGSLLFKFYAFKRKLAVAVVVHCMSNNHTIKGKESANEEIKRMEAQQSAEGTGFKRVPNRHFVKKSEFLLLVPDILSKN